MGLRGGCGASEQVIMGKNWGVDRLEKAGLVSLSLQQGPNDICVWDFGYRANLESVTHAGAANITATTCKSGSSLTILGRTSAGSMYTPGCTRQKLRSQGKACNPRGH